ncbi:MAG: hypothetical protein UW72_C0002G0020 [Parcubacteria group bacterium GW2011_GWF2_44_7]|nr:MAG: hypothetical protein UW72_C0002G0020 [Parcubacteria group bacterium GW2011_GWF2_44_7]
MEINIIEKNGYGGVNSKVEANGKMSVLAEKIIKWGIYVFVFLLPLFFLPFNSSILEVNKQVLIIAFALFFLIVWIGKIISQGRLEFKKSFVNIAVILFLSFYLVSSLLSKNIYQAMVGFGGGVAESFSVVVALAIIFFALANNLRDKKGISNALFALVLSGLVVAILTILQLAGKFILPWDFTQTATFNTIGSINSVEIFLASLLVLSSVLFAQTNVARWRQVFYGFAAILFLFMMLSINFTNVWWALLLAAIIIISLGIMNREQMNQYRLILPMVILAFSIIMLLIQPNFFKWSAIPAEVSPSFDATYNIDKEVLRGKLFFGSGPGSFAYNYGLYRSQDLNQTQFWNIKFNSGISKIFSQPATLGIFGWLTWVLMVVGFAIYGFIKLIRKRGSAWVLSLGIFSAWLLLAFLQFIYSTNLTLEAAFWIMLALSVLSLKFLDRGDEPQTASGEAGMAYVDGNNVLVQFEKNSPMASIFSFVFVVVLVLTISVFYLGGTYWFADVLYQRGLVTAAANNLEGSSTLISRAVTYNPYNELYLRTLSQVALLKVNAELAKPQSADRDRAAQNLIASATNLAKRSTELAPLSVDNWIQRAYIYRAIMPILPANGGADQWAIDSYNEAIKLEPKNPYYYWELGRTYALAVDLLTPGASGDKDKIAKIQDYVAKAEEAFKKALEVKSDYAPAAFNLALIYNLQGRIDEGIKEMSAAQTYSPEDIGITFQLGLLYYKKADWENARIQFERAINLDTSYSNARYFLGLIYDKLGNKAAAIEQFKKVEELNPENQEVKTIIANLQAGRPAIAEMPQQPSDLPISDKQPQNNPLQ